VRISGVAGRGQVGRPGLGRDPTLGRLGDADVIDRAAPTAPDLDDDRQRAVVDAPQRRPQADICGQPPGHLDADSLILLP